MKIIVPSLGFNFLFEDIAKHNLSLKTSQTKFVLCRCEVLGFMDWKFNLVKRKAIFVDPCCSKFQYPSNMPSIPYLQT